MAKDVKVYFERIVIPLISDRFPEVAAEMSIQIQGSYGLGIADKWSDLDALIYLDDALWKSRGGQVQLLLETELPRFAVKSDHCQICVWPVSWLDKLRGFLDNQSDPPWEEETIERLFEVQHNLVLTDPNGLFRRLKEATRPEQFPKDLWRKKLIDFLRDLYQDHLAEYRQCLRRGLQPECTILLGIVLEKLMHVGFLIHKKYYPWRTHLKWVFEKLPAPTVAVLEHIDSMSSSPAEPTNLRHVEAVLDIYCRHITENGILPTLNLLTSNLGPNQELEWAKRCKAWSKPKWRDWITGCQERAKKAGHTDHWWIWSLWGWE